MFGFLTSISEASPRHHHHKIHTDIIDNGNISLGGFFGGAGSRAASYIGTNPTGWGHRWCGKFMAMVAPNTAAKLKNPNLARNWATLPRTTAHVGAIAVMGRRGGGHVGIVTGFDENGNPRIVSGNHNHQVGEGVYPKGRIYAYVESLD